MTLKQKNICQIGKVALIIKNDKLDHFKLCILYSSKDTSKLEKKGEITVEKGICMTYN